jgi:hypothetical protein
MNSTTLLFLLPLMTCIALASWLLLQQQQQQEVQNLPWQTALRKDRLTRKEFDGGTQDWHRVREEVEHQVDVLRTHMSDTYASWKGGQDAEDNWLLVRDDSGQLEKVNVKELASAHPFASLKPTEQRLLVVFAFYNGSVERWPQAATAIPYYHRYLQLQGVQNYKIVMSEQPLETDKLFNKGSMFNVAFDQFREDADYILLMDIDSLPLLYRKPFTAGDYLFVDMRNPPTHTPEHIAPEVEKYGWSLPAQHVVGTGLKFTREAYQRVNGFSNNFYGWGREDDNLYLRIMTAFGDIQRPGQNEGLFHSLPHVDSSDSCGRLNYAYNIGYNAFFEAGGIKLEDDGLLQLQYRLLRKRHLKDWGGFYLIESEPQSPMIGHQRDRIPPEEIDACRALQNSELDK